MKKNQSGVFIGICDAVGRTIMMLPQPEISNGINVAALTKGIYLIKIMDEANKKIITKKFIKGT